MTHYTLADECLKGYSTLKNSGLIPLDGELVDLLRLGLTPSGIYCVEVERYNYRTKHTEKGFLYCGRDLEEANRVYDRHVTLRV